MSGTKTPFFNPSADAGRLLKAGAEGPREPMTHEIRPDLTVIGGGLAGVCAAITAAREGLKVALVQDRPVLGGNASSEVRLWILGATSHMGNNNRWSREGGVIDEILLENLYRNREGNPLIVDTILLEKVMQEPNIQLFLNTTVHQVETQGREIDCVGAFCSQNSTAYRFRSGLYCDASGDGIVSFLAGAAFRMGAESREEFGEGLAPTEDYGNLLGHSLYFYSKDTGRPVKYVAPSFALQDVTKIPRYRMIKLKEHGCRLWWIEYGGRLDTVHDTEQIRTELWRVIYGVWNYIKNSGEFPDADTHTLEWVGTIPGKRESRRFEGLTMVTQGDLVAQKRFEDTVSFGGWAMDLHPADGVYSDKPGCNQWHTKGVYSIPYRAMVSRDIDNLFYAGRIISVSHVAFSTTRVMATCAHSAQAVGMAAYLCKTLGAKPAQLLEREAMEELQRRLLRRGQYLPGVRLEDPEDLVAQADLAASSTLQPGGLPPDGPWLPLDTSCAQLLPLKAGRMAGMKIWLGAQEETTLKAELRISSKPENYTPDVTLATLSVDVKPGESAVHLNFDAEIPHPCYAFVCLMQNPGIKVRCSERRVSGLLSVFNGQHLHVGNTGAQAAPEGSGVESFEFWTPRRRPEGHNLAFELEAPIETYAVENLRNGVMRPTSQANAWVADWADEQPWIRIQWRDARRVSEIVLCFDGDFDHALESVLMGHPERIVPFCVQNYRITGANGDLIHEAHGNHQTLNRIQLPEPVETTELLIELEHPLATTPAALFAVRAY